ncbi:MAG: hypothetical protein ACK5XL_13200, partial [Cyclobacteriaceae bacterium]
PTGSAVLSDISALTFDYRYEYKKRQQGDRNSFSNNALIEVIVSYPESSPLLPQDFEDFKGGYRGFGYQNMRGTITLARLAEWGQRPGLSVILAPDARPVAQSGLPVKDLLYA